MNDSTITEEQLKEPLEHSEALRLEHEQVIEVTLALCEKFDVLQAHSEGPARQFGSTTDENEKLTELVPKRRSKCESAVRPS